MRYRAFISYSHADARQATWLHRQLEGYRLPSRLRGGSGEHGPLPERLPWRTERVALYAASRDDRGPVYRAL